MIKKWPKPLRPNAAGLVLAHTDEWDSLDNNKFLSLEAVQHVLRMFMQAGPLPSV